MPAAAIDRTNLICFSALVPGGIVSPLLKFPVWWILQATYVCHQEAVERAQRQRHGAPFGKCQGPCKKEK